MKTERAFKEWVDRDGPFLPLASVSEAARSMGVDDFDLDHYCKTRLKCGFLHWRKQYRIKRAVELIREDPYRPLNSIAIEVGIDDKTNFRRAFFDITGIQPGEYRDMARRQKESEARRLSSRISRLRDFIKLFRATYDKAGK
ncbi:MAG: AraC family transcriptional regulator [Bacteroidales bacterium]|nr:AraC family transcriptional regulator [Bacteroidales bacterium]